jgi:SOS-response transcriptional repressor LexA
MTKSCSPETVEKVHAFIVERIHIQGYGPTMREIATGCGFNSTGTAWVAVDALERQGRIRRSLDRRAIITLPESGEQP